MSDHSQYVDGILKEWGDRAFIKHVTVRRPTNIKKGAHTRAKKPPPPKNGTIKQQLLRTVVKTPEVMVKISGGGKDMGTIKAHLDYITRHGELEIEDENGTITKGKESNLDTKEAWKYSGIPIKEEGGQKKEAINIVLSMPLGTDAGSVTSAAREFAQEQFANHQYSFVTHTDTDNPHVHLVVKSVDKNGKRVTPRKADIQEYRQRFAEKLRDNGIQANATSRNIRGIIKKHEKKEVLEADKRIRSDASSGRKPKGQRSTIKQNQDDLVKREVRKGVKHVNPAQNKIRESRKSLNTLYVGLHEALKAGTATEKQLASLIPPFVKKMPSTKTRHQEKVVAMQSQQGGESKVIQKPPFDRVKPDTER